MDDNALDLKRVCIGFFGFIRNPLNETDFNRFRQLLPENCVIDIIISCPNKINEYDDHIINLDTINKLHSAFNSCNVNIDLYEYDPVVFIKRVRELGLPDYTSFPIYRIFSQHFSISRLCKNILKYSKHYDTIILTRMDILPGVSSLGNLLEPHENVMYLWRRYPYTSDIYAEDRIIISSIDGVRTLSDLYDSGPKNVFIYEDLCPENILGKYLSSFNNLVILPQEGVKLELSPSMNVKYSKFSKDYLEGLLKNIV